MPISRLQIIDGFDLSSLIQDEEAWLAQADLEARMLLRTSEYAENWCFGPNGESNNRVSPSLNLVQIGPTDYHSVSPFKFKEDQFPRASILFLGSRYT